MWECSIKRSLSTPCRKLILNSHTQKPWNRCMQKSTFRGLKVTAMINCTIASACLLLTNLWVCRFCANMWIVMCNGDQVAFISYRSNLERNVKTTRCYLVVNRLPVSHQPNYSILQSPFCNSRLAWVLHPTFKGRKFHHSIVSNKTIGEWALFTVLVSLTLRFAAHWKGAIKVQKIITFLWTKASW